MAAIVKILSDTRGTMARIIFIKPFIFFLIVGRMIRTLVLF